MKNVLFLLIFSLGTNFLFCQDVSYNYQFNKKLRFNVDQLIANGVEDTCGVIVFNYPINLSNGEDNALVFQVENDCSPVIDLANLIPFGNFIEINIDHKYHTYIKGKEVKKEEVSKKLRDLLTEFQSKKDFPKIMLRVERSCKDREKINAILNTIHYSYYSSDLDYPLIFDLGKTSRAEPPKMEMYIDQDTD